jgi:hypothetical protein
MTTPPESADGCAQSVTNDDIADEPIPKLRDCPGREMPSGASLFGLPREAPDGPLLVGGVTCSAAAVDVISVSRGVKQVLDTGDGLPKTRRHG